MYEYNIYLQIYQMLFRSAHKTKIAPKYAIKSEYKYKRVGMHNSEWEMQWAHRGKCPINKYDTIRANIINVYNGK